MTGTARLLAASVTACLALVPPWIESAARTTIEASSDRCESSLPSCVGLRTVTVRGLEFMAHGVSAARTGWRVEIDTVRMHPRWTRLDIRLGGVVVDRSPMPRDLTPTSSATQGADDASPPASSPPGRLPNLGIPIRVSSEDTISVASGDERLRIHTLAVDVDGSGTPTISIDADARTRFWWGASVGPLHARPLHGWKEWAVRGQLRLADGPPLAMQSVVSPDRSRVELGDARSGSLRLDIERRPTLRVAARANGIELDALGLGTSVHGISTDTATLWGDLELTRDRGIRAHLGDLRADGIAIHDPRLSRHPVELDQVSVTGDVWVKDRTTIEGQVTLGHGSISTYVAGSVRPTGIDLEAALAPLSCQELLDSVPEGIMGPLGGTLLRGNIDGRVSLSLSWPPTPATASPSDKLGVVDVEFPFLERCTVTADPPTIDVAGLVGAYRHTFIDGLGRTRERILAPGAPGYVALSDVPLLAAAFVTLEDSRFWRHDGFDREQLERALWHNLGQGQIERGASTITQQTARNLFLGLDRSLARKLQEALLATRLEQALTKERILELYLNVIELGPGVHGADDAAQFHFGRSARELSVLQAVHLASLAPAPHRFSERFQQGRVDEAWMDKLHEQVRRMHLHGRIGIDALRGALKDRLRLRVRSTGPT